MPGGDRTGPRGMGPGTGRAAGFCAGAGRPGFMSPRPGRGFGGGGHGRRIGYHATGLPGWARGGGDGGPFAPPGSPQGRDWLEARIAALQAQLEAVRQQLNGWTNNPPTE